MLFISSKNFFDHVGKWFDKKTKVNFKICAVANWKKDSCNTHITQYLKK